MLPVVYITLIHVCVCVRGNVVENSKNFCTSYQQKTKNFLCVSMHTPTFHHFSNVGILIYFSISLKNIYFQYPF